MRLALEVAKARLTKAEAKKVAPSLTDQMVAKIRTCDRSRAEKEKDKKSRKRRRKKARGVSSSSEWRQR